MHVIYIKSRDITSLITRKMYSGTCGRLTPSPTVKFGSIIIVMVGIKSVKIGSMVYQNNVHAHGNGCS